MNRVPTLIACLFLLSLSVVAGPVWARSDIVGTEKKLYSQWNEEIVIRDFFQDRREGTFLDIGASHPRKNNTTFYLEKHLGWTGIGVDAAEEYRAGWEKFRPDSKFFVYLITDHSGTMDKFYRSAFLPISSAKKKMIEKVPEEHITEIEVPSITLNDLLEKEGVKKIDFLSMDIEGSQYEALQGFDIQKYRPELVCIEKDRPEDIPPWFEEHGYELLEGYAKYDIVNWYFAPKDRTKVEEAAAGEKEG